jgi:quercetin dioxygenase-like cupin family protein
MSSAETPANERLRQHPTDRFAGPEHIFNLPEVANSLQQEAHQAQNGHRQVTIFHRDAVTMVLFAFEAGGEMREHRANGLVNIHVLEGRMSITTPSQTYQLQTGNLLVLDAEVPHSVRAEAASRMLLTVTRA